jgi:hypothetical protein
MLNNYDWEKYSEEISAENPLDTNKSRGSVIIYAPEIAEELGFDKRTLFYFTWKDQSLRLRVYESESSHPIELDEKEIGYKPGDVSSKIVKGITLPNSKRPPLDDVSYWYNYIQHKNSEWFTKENDNKTALSDSIKIAEVKANNGSSVEHYKKDRVSDKLKDVQAYLIDHKDEVYSYLYTTNEQYKKFTEQISNFRNEGIWVFLVGCGYALGKKSGVEKLTRLLTGFDLDQPVNPKIWLEAEPTEPRIKEGKTHLDIALGAISRREETGSGINLDNSAPSWICFCEAKFNSDISPSVTYDENRNQLARVIENAICFQSSGKYADNVYATIITPITFKDRRPLLEEKFNTYKANPKNLINDLVGCCLAKNRKSYWVYPTDIDQRIMSSLKLQWVYFDDLIESLPCSDISEQLKSLWYKLCE